MFVSVVLLSLLTKMPTKNSELAPFHVHEQQKKKANYYGRKSAMKRDRDSLFVSFRFVSFQVRMEKLYVYLSGAMSSGFKMKPIHCYMYMYLLTIQSK